MDNTPSPRMDVYSPDDVVWVKAAVGMWWPAVVQDQAKLDPEITAGLKKTPLVVVKFLEEDYYWTLNSLNNINRYNCEKKNEYLEKGFRTYDSHKNEKNMTMFPTAVEAAEKITGGNPGIVTEYIEKIRASDTPTSPAKRKNSAGSKRPNYTGSRSRKITVELKYFDFERPGPPIEPTPTIEVVQFCCDLCDEVFPLYDSMIFHKTSAHRVGQMCRSGPLKTMRILAPVKKKKKVRVVKTLESQTKRKSTEKPKVQKRKKIDQDESKKLEVSQEAASILNDWDEEAEVEGDDESIQLPTAASTPAPASLLTDKSETFIDDESMSELSTIHEKESSTAALADENHSNSKLNDSNTSRSAFDFEDDEPQNSPTTLRFGQKLPRLRASDKSKDKSVESLIDDDLERLLEETSVPVLPDLPETERTARSTPLKLNSDAETSPPPSPLKGNSKSPISNEKRFLAEGPLRSRDKKSLQTEGAEDGSGDKCSTDTKEPSLACNENLSLSSSRKPHRSKRKASTLQNASKALGDSNPEYENKQPPPGADDSLEFSQTSKKLKLYKATEHETSTSVDMPSKNSWGDGKRKSERQKSKAEPKVNDIGSNMADSILPKDDEKKETNISVNSFNEVKHVESSLPPKSSSLVKSDNIVGTPEDKRKAPDQDRLRKSLTPRTGRVSRKSFKESLSTDEVKLVNSDIQPLPSTLIDSMHENERGMNIELSKQTKCEVSKETSNSHLRIETNESESSSVVPAALKSPSIKNESSAEEIGASSRKVILESLKTPKRGKTKDKEEQKDLDVDLETHQRKCSIPETPISKEDPGVRRSMRRSVQSSKEKRKSPEKRKKNKSRSREDSKKLSSDHARDESQTLSNSFDESNPAACKEKSPDDPSDSTSKNELDSSKSQKTKGRISKKLLTTDLLDEMGEESNKMPDDSFETVAQLPESHESHCSVSTAEKNDCSDDKMEQLPLGRVLQSSEENASPQLSGGDSQHVQGPFPPLNSPLKKEDLGLATSLSFDFFQPPKEIMKPQPTKRPEIGHSGEDSRSASSQVMAEKTVSSVKSPYKKEQSRTSPKRLNSLYSKERISTTEKTPDSPKHRETRDLSENSKRLTSPKLPVESKDSKSHSVSTSCKLSSHKKGCHSTAELNKNDFPESPKGKLKYPADTSLESPKGETIENRRDQTKKLPVTVLQIESCGLESPSPPTKSPSKSRESFKSDQQPKTDVVQQLKDDSQESTNSKGDKILNENTKNLSGDDLLRILEDPKNLFGPSTPEKLRSKSLVNNETELFDLDMRVMTHELESSSVPSTKNFQSPKAKGKSKLDHAVEKSNSRESGDDSKTFMDTDLQIQKNKNISLSSPSKSYKKKEDNEKGSLPKQKSKTENTHESPKRRSSRTQSRESKFSEADAQVESKETKSLASSSKSPNKKERSSKEKSQNRELYQSQTENVESTLKKASKSSRSRETKSGRDQSGVSDVDYRIEFGRLSTSLSTSPNKKEVSQMEKKRLLRKSGDLDRQEVDSTTTAETQNETDETTNISNKNGKKSLVGISPTIHIPGLQESDVKFPHSGTREPKKSAKLDSQHSLASDQCHTLEKQVIIPQNSDDNVSIALETREVLEPSKVDDASVEEGLSSKSLGNVSKIDPRVVSSHKPVDNFQLSNDFILDSERSLFNSPASGRQKTSLPTVLPEPTNTQKLSTIMVSNESQDVVTRGSTETSMKNSNGDERKMEVDGKLESNNELIKHTKAETDTKDTNVFVEGKVSTSDASLPSPKKVEAGLSFTIKPTSLVKRSSQFLSESLSYAKSRLDKNARHLDAKQVFSTRAGSLSEDKPSSPQICLSPKVTHTPNANEISPTSSSEGSPIRTSRWDVRTPGSNQKTTSPLKSSSAKSKIEFIQLSGVRTNLAKSHTGVAEKLCPSPTKSSCNTDNLNKSSCKTPQKELVYNGDVTGSDDLSAIEADILSYLQGDKLDQKVDYPEKTPEKLSSAVGFSEAEALAKLLQSDDPPPILNAQQNEGNKPIVNERREVLEKTDSSVCNSELIRPSVTSNRSIKAATEFTGSTPEKSKVVGLSEAEALAKLLQGNDIPAGKIDLLKEPVNDARDSQSDEHQFSSTDHSAYAKPASAKSPSSATESIAPRSGDQNLRLGGQDFDIDSIPIVFEGMFDSDSSIGLASEEIQSSPPATVSAEHSVDLQSPSASASNSTPTEDSKRPIRRIVKRTKLMVMPFYCKDGLPDPQKMAGIEAELLKAIPNSKPFVTYADWLASPETAHIREALAKPTGSVQTATVSPNVGTSATPIKEKTVPSLQTAVIRMEPKKVSLGSTIGFGKLDVKSIKSRTTPVQRSASLSKFPQIVASSTVPSQIVGTCVQKGQSTKMSVKPTTVRTGTVTVGNKSTAAVNYIVLPARSSRYVSCTTPQAVVRSKSTESTSVPPTVKSSRPADILAQAMADTEILPNDVSSFSLDVT